ncbi:hypothetical protein CJ030_MR4G005809 [Morella rubra]|uniref:Uncharacterized protein n=1 Tax=Morella rubra TaxID=262757 RepID=A0A6A1VU04_9ROSI|nr:hypothetical protein CJ030_MR4G005809 [Morella rubra]
MSLNAKETREEQDDSYTYDMSGTDGTSFEVDTSDRNIELVNIGEREFTRGRWQLNGIPCAHASDAIDSDKLLPEAFVDPCYCQAAYATAYALVTHAMPGLNEWPHADVTPIGPPTVRSMPGRLRKARVMAPAEPQYPYNVIRFGLPDEAGPSNIGTAPHPAKRGEKGGQNNHCSQLVIRSHHNQCNYDDHLERRMHLSHQGKNLLKQGQELRVGPSRCNSSGARQGILYFGLVSNGTIGVVLGSSVVFKQVKSGSTS